LIDLSESQFAVVGLAKDPSATMLDCLPIGEMLRIAFSMVQFAIGR
jgi:hypothetical protein